MCPSAPYLFFYCLTPDDFTRVETLQLNGLIFQTNITGMESIYVCIVDIVHECIQHDEKILIVQNIFHNSSYKGQNYSNVIG